MNRDRYYEGLVKRLNDYSAQKQFHGGITAEAADAIEALPEERDAAVKDILRECRKCTYWGKTTSEQPCYDCWHVVGTSKSWEWHGLQKRGAK